MKTVIHIVDGQVVRSQVPNDWIKCTVTGEYRPPEEFQDEGIDYQTRTNCTRSYYMSREEMDQCRGLQKQLQPEIDRLQLELEIENADQNWGMPIGELITQLQGILAANPDARYCGPDIEVKKGGYKNLYDIDEGYYRSGDYYF